MYATFLPIEGLVLQWVIYRWLDGCHRTESGFGDKG